MTIALRITWKRPGSWDAGCKAAKIRLKPEMRMQAMKKICLGLVCILILILTCGCSTDFSQQAEEGDFSFAYGKKSAFVTEYRWDGTEEGKTILIPASYNDLKVVSVGGFFGRGLAMPFSVDISGFFGADVQWVEPDDAFGSPEETVELNFTLVLPEGLDEEDVSIAGAEEARWILEEEGKITEYKVCITLDYLE